MVGWLAEGPQRYIKKYKVFVPKAKSDILEATMLLQGQQYPLLFNRITASILDSSPETMFVYHSYGYILEDGSFGRTRWYDTQIPRGQLLPNDTFTYICEQYEVEDEETGESTFVNAVYTLRFTPKAAAKLRAL